MASNLDSQIAQLLNQAPNFRTSGPNLRRDFGSAHYDRSMID